jgi:SHS2 domain-containing protein
MAGFELLEHTADIGIRAVGASLEEVFEQATAGLVEVMGAARPGPVPVDRVPLAVVAGDVGGLLVDWLGEVLWLLEVTPASLAGVGVDRVAAGRAAGTLDLGPPAEEPDGTVVKAVTYHRLRVERTDGGWLAEVYLDV